MRWLQHLFHRRIFDDLSEEIRQHLDEKIEALMAEGISRQEAEHTARREFGNVTRIEERGREPWQFLRLESALSDAKYALRQLYNSPIFSATVIITITLGIGANAAIFNLMHAVVFPSLPVSKPSQIYTLRSVSTPNDAVWLYSGPAFDRLRAAPSAGAQVAAHTSVSTCTVASTGSNQPVPASMQLVSTNLFSVLGLAPLRGRFLLDSDVVPGGGAWPVVLRYGFWREHFASDPSIVGKSFLVNGIPVTIVGVAPDRFLGVVPGELPDLWLPLEAQKDVRYIAPFDSLGYGSGTDLGAPYRHQDPLFWLTLIARVPPQAEYVAVAAWTQAFQPDLALFAKFITREQRASVLAAKFTLHPIGTSEGTMFNQYARPLTVLMCMVGAILLIAWVNLANLQSTRLVSRQREFALRASLGAGRARILQQLLIESSILIAVGGAFALLLAIVSGPVLLRWASQNARPIPLDLHPGFELYGFIAALLLMTMFAYALIPAWRMMQIDIAISIRGNASQQVGQPNRRLWSNLMLASQIALSLLLLVLSSMFTRTLLNLNHVDTGFDRHHILTIRTTFDRAGYQEPRMRALAPQMIDLLQSLPGIRAATLDMCPLPRCLWNGAIHAAGHPDLSESAMQAHQDNVGSGYFHTLGIPVIEGREFTDEDRPGTQPAAIVNQSLAKKLFGNADPVGQKVGFGRPPADSQFTVIGVVGDARVSDLRSPPPPVFYRPLEQDSLSVGGIEVRTSGEPLLIANEVHRALLTLDPQMPITEINSLSAAYESTLTTEQLLVRLTSIFGGLALALAAVGLYGVLSFRIARSTSEIGVRMALGATRTDILRMVMTQATRIFLLGSSSGAALAIIAGRLIHRLLFGVSSADALSLSLSILMLGMAGALAAFLPARRAASIDPLTALRAE
jgi:predicted permease